VAQARLKLTRRQLGTFLEDFESIKQFENLFSTVDESTVTGGGNTYDDLPQASTSTIVAVLNKITAQLEAIATAYPGTDKAWSKNELNNVLTRLEALETEYPGNTKAWVKGQKFLSGSKVDSFNTRFGAVTLTSGDVTGALTFTPISKAGDTGIGALTINGVNSTAGFQTNGYKAISNIGTNTYFWAGTGNLYIVDQTGSFVFFSINGATGAASFGIYPVSQTPVAFASLPAGSAGMRAFINNNSAGAAFGSAANGAGAATYPVYHDGASWKIG